jgi:transcriptional regulator with XRE-family HTH domain
MSDQKQRERLATLLGEMQGDLSQRAFARQLRINYASLSSYMFGEQFPETKNLEKIAAAKRWTREELEAFLESRTVQPKRSLDEVLQEVRAMPPQDALIVARTALDVMDSAFS